MRHLLVTIVFCLLFSTMKIIFDFETLVITALAMAVAYFIILDGKIEDITDEIKKLKHSNEEKNPPAGML